MLSKISDVNVNSSSGAIVNNTYPRLRATLDTKSKCAIVALLIGGVAGIVIAALGGLNIFGSIGTSGFIVSMAGGGTLLCVAISGVTWIAITKRKNHQSQTLKLPMNRVNKSEINLDRITTGQGEYVVFHKLSNGENKELSRETFEKVYIILNQYSPIEIINSVSEKMTEECNNRYEIIKSKIKEIDSTLEIAFVPRTLYELIFIRKCIKEDLKNKSICSFLNPALHGTGLKNFEEDQLGQIEKRPKCWHLCYFSDNGDNNHFGVRDVAYRLNQTIVKKFAPSDEGFSFQEFSHFAEKEIEFLKAHYKNCLEISKKMRAGEGVEAISDVSNPGPTTNFGYETKRGLIKPMGIRDETDARIIRDAMALDCSQVARHSLYLYRGADFQKDSASCLDDQNKPYSLSYGTSLFAGCLYDGGATAFYHMRNGKNAYAIAIPFDQLNDSLFYVPQAHTVTQLFGDGEVFHARTKAWRDYDVQKIEGIDLGVNGRKREHLKSNLSKDILIEQFRKYKASAIQLK